MTLPHIHYNYNLSKRNRKINYNLYTCWKNNVNYIIIWNYKHNISFIKNIMQVEGFGKIAANRWNVFRSQVYAAGYPVDKVEANLSKIERVEREKDRAIAMTPLVA